MVVIVTNADALEYTVELDMNVEHGHVMASFQQGRAQLWPTHYLMLFVFTVRTKFQFYDYLLNSFMGAPERTAVQAKGAQSSLLLR